MRRTLDYLEIRQPSGNPERARLRHPAIHAAFALWEQESPRELLRLLVLADCPRAAIARRLGVPGAVVLAAEQIFFDIRPQLSADAWIRDRVIIPALAAGDYRTAGRLKFAFAGGPAAAELLLDAQAELPFGPAERLDEAAMLLHLKAVAALDVPLDSPADLRRFQESYLKFRAAEIQLEVERLRCASRCERDRRRLNIERRPLQARGSAGEPAAARRTAGRRQPSGLQVGRAAAAREGRGRKRPGPPGLDQRRGRGGRWTAEPQAASAAAAVGGRP